MNKTIAPETEIESNGASGAIELNSGMKEPGDVVPETVANADPASAATAEPCVAVVDASSDGAADVTVTEGDDDAATFDRGDEDEDQVMAAAMALERMETAEPPKTAYLLKCHAPCLSCMGHSSGRAGGM